MIEFSAPSLTRRTSFRSAQKTPPLRQCLSSWGTRKRARPDMVTVSLTILHPDGSTVGLAACVQQHLGPEDALQALDRARSAQVRVLLMPRLFRQQWKAPAKQISKQFNGRNQRPPVTVILRLIWTSPKQFQPAHYSHNWRPEYQRPSLMNTCLSAVSRNRVTRCSHSLSCWHRTPIREPQHHGRYG